MINLKSKTIVFVLGFLIVLVGCSSGDSQNNVTTDTTNSSHSDEVEDGHVRITVKQENEYITEEEIPVEKGDNLLEVMKSKFFIEQSSGDITSIERVRASEEDHTIWKYYVNGEEIDVKPEDYTVSSGDKIVFDLQVLDENKKGSSSNKTKDNSHVIHALDEGSRVIYAAIPDEQFQYAIPITFVISKDMNVNEAYNNIEQYLKENKLLDEHFLLSGVTYEIQEEEKQVQVQLPENYSIDSSAEAYMFEKLLSNMFVPMGIEKITFAGNTELGPFGDIEELQLRKESSSYKIYHDSFLIPVPSEELSIEEAISYLKEDRSEFDVQQTIHDEINFSVESDGNMLQLSYSGPSELKELKEVTIMIESILMTAKTYGFEQVVFKNMPVGKVGNYSFADSIEVPIAVNPIFISN